MCKYLAIAFFSVALISCNGSGSGVISGSNSQDLQDLVAPGEGPSSDGVLAGYKTLPTMIQAEDYIEQQGIGIGQTTDSGGSDFLGWISGGDYTTYTINVPQAGAYKLDARVSSSNQAAEIRFIVNGAVGGSVTVNPTGSWDNWETVSTTLQLPDGDQTLQLLYSGGDSPGLMNINWFSLAAVEINSPPIEDEKLDSSDWIVYSSVNTQDAYFAIDGLADTRWTTEIAQASGQQFFVNMRSSMSFDRIVLDASMSRGDYPRSYLVEVSLDGLDWSTVALDSNATDDPTVIDFSDQDAAYIKISQLGVASRNWWSINELSVFANSSDSQTTVPSPSTDFNVETLSELHAAIQQDNQLIVMKPGNYSIADLPERGFVISGNDNEIDLTGVTIDFPVDETSDPHFLITGSGNTFKNGTIENSYPGGQDGVTDDDYVSYNQDRDGLANGAGAHMKIEGDGNSIIGTKIIIKGSFPYGYGSYFGIGGVNVFGLSKRGGIDVTPGKNTTIDGIKMIQQAYGHGIYFGEGSDNIVIRNSLIVGAVRPTNDMLSEGFGSLPYLSGYADEEGNLIPSNEVESLAEDGIRAYSGSGSVTVESSVVRNMRGGIRLYLAGSAQVTNTVSVDNGLANFSMSRGSTVTGSSANFTYGPVNDFPLSRSGQNFDITILPSPNAVGSHNIADIKGDSHEITFRRASGPEDTLENRVIAVSGNNSTIRNETEYAIVLESGTTGNAVVSAGQVTDHGDNDVTQIDLEL